MPSVVQVTNEQVQLTAFGGNVVPTGVGTGIVIDDQGHILTNDHVIRGAQRLLITTAQGNKQYPARLIGADPRSDLAVLQVKGVHLQPLPLGNSSQLQVGQWVVAIGNALALPGGPTVTTGVISALNRTVQEPSSGNTPGPYLFGVIQTSAPINPGNSGGPLVNLQGQVVGINTWIAVGTEPGGPQAEGIGFAIAINTARHIAQLLIKNGHVTYAYLGVLVTTSNAALDRRFGLPDTPGVIVIRVEPNSPASHAGIQAGDIITQVGPTTITSDSDLAEALTELTPHQQIPVTWVVARTGQKITRTVTLGTITS